MNRITGRRRKRPTGPRIQVFLMEDRDGKFRVTNSVPKIDVDVDERFPGGPALPSRIAIKVAAVVGCEPQDLTIYDRVVDCVENLSSVELIFTGDTVDKFLGVEEGE